MINVFPIPDGFTLELTQIPDNGCLNYITSGRFYAITGFNDPPKPDINKWLILSALLSSVNLLKDIYIKTSTKLTPDEKQQLKTALDNTAKTNTNEMNNSARIANTITVIQTQLSGLHKYPMYNAPSIDNNNIATMPNYMSLVSLINNLQSKLPEESSSVSTEDNGAVQVSPKNTDDVQVETGGSKRRRKLFNQTKQKIKGRQRKTKTSKRR
jgi:hypothetical protein